MHRFWGRAALGAVLGIAALTQATPARALDIVGYGSIGVGTFWTQTKAFRTAGPTGPSSASMTDGDFSLDLFGDSRVGLRAKEGDFSAVAEMGAYNPKAYSKGPELRMLFGDWDFGGGKIRVGKLPSPYVYRTQQVWDADGGMNGYGSLFDGRYAQLKVTMNNGFYADFLQPRVGNSGNNTSNVTPNADVLAAYSQTGNTFATTFANYNTFLPKIILGYEGKLDIWTYGGGVAYNLYNVKTRTAAGGTPTIAGAPNVDEDVHSYLVFFHGNVNLAPVEIAYNIFTGRNVGDLMSTATGNGTSNTLSNPGSANGAYFDVVHGVDSFTYGGWGQIGYIFSPKVKAYAAVSYVVDDNRISHADERMAMFAQLSYAPTSHFRIVPEVGYMNDMHNTLGQREPRTFYAGSKWEMTF